MKREDWPEYVQRITAGVPRKNVAGAAGIDVSGLSRWASASNKPRAEKVVAFARGLGQSPVEALIAAGYLEPHEAGKVIEVVRSLSEIPDEEILAQVASRLQERLSGPKVDRITLKLARRDDEFGEGVQDA